MSALWASLFHTAVVASEVDAERESSATFSQYNGNGLSFQSDNNTFSLRVRGRFQFRYANPGISQPTERADFEHNAGNQFGVNRARVKLDGHIGLPWIKYGVDMMLSISAR